MRNFFRRFRGAARRHDEATLSALYTLLRQGSIIMADLTTLKASVAKIEGAQKSIIAFCNGLGEQLKTASANNDQAAIDAIAAQLSSDADGIAAAITANSPGSGSASTSDTPAPTTADPAPGA